MQLFPRYHFVKKFKSGFTLIELLIAITIISVISVIAVANYRNLQKNARDAVRKADIAAIAQAYEVNYNFSTGQYPPLTGSSFATNTIPVSPNGSAYSGLISSNASSFQVCAALENNPQSSCNEPDPLCFCVSSAQNVYVGVASPSPSGQIVIPNPPVSLNPMPENYMVFDSNRTGNHEIYAMNLDTEAVTRLTTNSSQDSWWGRISPDRSKILFYRNSTGSSEDYESTSLWMMNADGTNQHQIIAAGAYEWGGQGHAEWTRDNNRLIMFGGPSGNFQIVGTDSNGQNPEIYTLRPGTNIDPAPNLIDDSNFIYIGCAQATCYEQNYEMYVQSKTAHPNISTPLRVTNDLVRDHDPYFSPDNTKIAWLRNAGAGDANPNGMYWSIWLLNLSTGIHTPVIADNNINSRPEWSKNGEWIYFHRMVIGQTNKFDIYKIRPNGSDLTPVTLGQSGSNQYPSL